MDEEITILQDFSEAVAGDATGMTHADVSSRVKAGVLEWIGLVEMIMTMVSKLIEQCQASKEEIRAAVKQPSMWQRVRVRRIVRDECDACGVANWRHQGNRIANSLISTAATAGDEMVDAIVRQVRSAT